MALSNFLDSPVEFETPCAPHPSETVRPTERGRISEDLTHYARNPEKQLQFKRLLLIVKGKRSGIVY